MMEAAGFAQPLRLYSEFRRVGADGQIIAQDSEGMPREILSPAALRGSRLSYRLVVTGPPGKTYWLYAGANPEDSIQHQLYREREVDGIPDSLEPVQMPVFGTLGDGRNVDTYLLDLYIPKTTPERRVRFEAQLNMDNRWVIYPLEVRVSKEMVPEVGLGEAHKLAPARVNSAQAALDVYRGFVCGTEVELRADGAAENVRTLIERNARQDIVLANKVEERYQHETIADRIATAFGASDAKSWCAAPTPATYDPEIVLKARDYLFRSAGN
jgi:hypothetical protein